jgi:hypothetical protein
VEDGPIFSSSKNLRASLSNDDLSNEPNFGRIHLVGQYLDLHISQDSIWPALVGQPCTIPDKTRLVFPCTASLRTFGKNMFCCLSTLIRKIWFKAFKLLSFCALVLCRLYKNLTNLCFFVADGAHFKRSLFRLSYISFFGSKIGLHLKPQAVSRSSGGLPCGHIIALVSCACVRSGRRGNMREARGGASAPAEAWQCTLLKKG